MRRTIASGLLLLAAGILALVRLRDPGASGREPGGRRAPAPQTQAPANPAPETGRSPGAPATRRGALALESLPEGDLRAQVQRVAESMERSGRPPEGVAQGGRRGGQRGLFDNAGAKLPRQPRGYYTESDVWPRVPGSNRGTERLIFGRGGEVYYTADHYRTFTRLR